MLIDLDIPNCQLKFPENVGKVGNSNNDWHELALTHCTPH
jgi:hypothetical protein